MTETQPEQPISLADVATEPPDTSVERELDALGDEPDTGDLTTEDDAQ